MALFGKGRRAIKKNLLDTEVNRGRAGNRKYLPRQVWDIEDTQFSIVQKTFGDILGQLHGKHDFILERFKEKGKPVIVLDWGCGQGQAISGFAEAYEDKIVAIGCSKDAYRSWQEIKNAKLIQATEKDLPRYFKDNSITLIYSYTGISHLPDIAQYMKVLVPKIEPKGKIVFTVSPFGDAVKLFERIKKELEENCTVELHGGEWGKIYITKLK